jgi:hypothetical protein
VWMSNNSHGAVRLSNVNNVCGNYT